MLDEMDLPQLFSMGFRPLALERIAAGHAIEIALQSSRGLTPEALLQLAYSYYAETFPQLQWPMRENLH